MAIEEMAGEVIAVDIVNVTTTRMANMEKTRRSSTVKSIRTRGSTSTNSMNDQSTIASPSLLTWKSPRYRLKISWSNKFLKKPTKPKWMRSTLRSQFCALKAKLSTKSARK